MCVDSNINMTYSGLCLSDYVDKFLSVNGMQPANKQAMLYSLLIIICLVT